MRNKMGSWGFVFGFLVFMVLWAALNTVLLATNAFDKYPYVFLNLFLSMLAGLQGAVLLIAAKRADHIAGELATHDYEINKTSLSILEEIRGETALLNEIHKHVTAATPQAGDFPPSA